MINKSSANQAKEKSAQFFWTIFILMFFVIQMCIWTFAISVTAGDTSHAIVDGYDEQALTWDEVKNAKLESSRLCWRGTFFLDRTGDIHGNRNLTFKLTDSNNNPIVNAQLEISCFHRAAASERQNLEFNQVGPGIYSSTINVQRFGKWCFAGTARVETQQFLVDEVMIIANSNKTAR